MSYKRNTMLWLTACRSTTWYCPWEPCANGGTNFARKANLERHVKVIHHRDTLQLVDCLIEGYHRRGPQNGFMRKDMMIQHMRDVHGVDIPKKARGRERVE